MSCREEEEDEEEVKDDDNDDDDDCGALDGCGTAIPTFERRGGR